MIKKGKMPITGARPEYSKKQPYVPDAKETSADEQRFIDQAPMPFKDKTSLGSLPVSGTGPKGAVPGPVQKPYAGLQHSNPGAKALPQMGPIGQRKPINQSGQIGGHMGWPPPQRKAGTPFSQGGKTQSSKRNARFYGES